MEVDAVDGRRCPPNCTVSLARREHAAVGVERRELLGRDARAATLGGAVTRLHRSVAATRRSSQPDHDAAQPVADLREAAGDVQQDDQQPDARREQRNGLVRSARTRAARTPTTRRRPRRPGCRALRSLLPIRRPANPRPGRSVRSTRSSTASPPSTAPPSPAMNPPSANAVSFARVGETVSAAAAGSFSRTPMIMRPIPVVAGRPAMTSTTTSVAEYRSSSTRGCER